MLAVPWHRSTIRPQSNDILLRRSSKAIPSFAATCWDLSWHTWSLCKKGMYLFINEHQTTQTVVPLNVWFERSIKGKDKKGLFLRISIHWPSTVLSLAHMKRRYKINRSTRLKWKRNATQENLKFYSLRLHKCCSCEQDDRARRGHRQPNPYLRNWYLSKWLFLIGFVFFSRVSSVKTRAFILTVTQVIFGLPVAHRVFWGVFLTQSSTVSFVCFINFNVYVF